MEMERNTSLKKQWSPHEKSVGRQRRSDGLDSLTPMKRHFGKNYFNPEVKNKIPIFTMMASVTVCVNMRRKETSLSAALRSCPYSLGLFTLAKARASSWSTLGLNYLGTCALHRGRAWDFSCWGLWLGLLATWFHILWSLCDSIQFFLIGGKRNATKVSSYRRYFHFHIFRWHEVLLPRGQDIHKTYYDEVQGKS